MEGTDIPFLCHRSNDYAKIMWKKGEAIGFYSVKPTGKTLEYCGIWGDRWERKGAYLKNIVSSRLYKPCRPNEMVFS